ncbi:MAG TPA: IS1380 family transposase [Acidimicrobiales bacterium]|nr:IS1380 family transposase [Acidimicrobiales bacterium]
MKATALAFELDDTIAKRSWPAVAHPLVEAGEDSVTGVAGIVLWGEMLDHLGLVGECDRRVLRPIGPGGYTGGECYRAVVETQLAGGDFLSDRSLLADEATQRLRGEHALASHTTLWRFCAGADLGRAQIAAAVNRAMLRRAWAMGAAPGPGLLTIDPDATWISTYGPGKEGSAFSYKHEVGMSPMVGVCGETGDVLALRARGGSANAGRALGSFVDECVTAIPKGWRGDYQLWVRVDSAGYRADVVEAAERHNAAFSITAKGYTNVKKTIESLAADPATVWSPALGAEDVKGSQVAECAFSFAGRDLRMIVRRQPTVSGDQLSFDDLDGFRFHAIITNIPPQLGTAVQVEHHHRLRGGAPEEAIRQLKADFGLCHAPLENFFGNWVWWHAAALAYNVARWVRVLALPKQFSTCRGKRLRLSFFNVAARVVRHAGQLILRLPRAYSHAVAFIEALARLRALPDFT